jgi:hypothetical protein
MPCIVNDNDGVLHDNDGVFYGYSEEYSLKLFVLQRMETSTSTGSFSCAIMK